MEQTTSLSRVKIEIWKPVPGWKMYLISSKGRVFSKHSNKIRFVPAYINKCGRASTYITLKNQGRKWRVSIARLMLMAFIGPTPTLKCVARHLDDVADHNELKNIAWGTRKDNAKDAVRNGRMHLFSSGKNHPKAVSISYRTAHKIKATFIPGTPGLSWKQQPNSKRALANRYGLSVSTIESIIAGRHWSLRL